MKGAYVLIIDIKEPVMIQIKSLGEVTFQLGKWVYVGSAMGNGSTNLENRIKRHFRTEKTVYWHIDHLLDQGVELQKAYWIESPRHAECDIAQELELTGTFGAGPKQFGSSDCKRGCSAHIFRFQSERRIDEVIETAFQNLGLKPSVTSDGIL